MHQPAGISTLHGGFHTWGDPNIDVNPKHSYTSILRLRSTMKSPLVVGNPHMSYGLNLGWGGPIGDFIQFWR